MVCVCPKTGLRKWKKPNALPGSAGMFERRTTTASRLPRISVCTASGSGSTTEGVDFVIAFTERFTPFFCHAGRRKSKSPSVRIRRLSMPVVASKPIIKAESSRWRRRAECKAAPRTLTKRPINAWFGILAGASLPMGR